MFFDTDNTTMFFMIAGIVIMTASLLLHQLKRRQRELTKQTQRRATLEAAQEAERKRQLQTGKPVKTKPERYYSTASDRIPLPDLSEKQFTGAYSPRNIAKWEAEIHQIGRQMIGTLDSKMVALQTLTQEANRAANRIELLLERFEQFAETQFNPKSPQNEETTPPKPPENLPNLIPAGTAELPAKSLVLNDLQSDRLLQQPDRIEESSETIPHATILKVEEIKENNSNSGSDSNLEGWSPSTESLRQRLPSTISLSTNNPLSFGSLGLPEKKSDGKSERKLSEAGKETKSSYYEKPMYSPETANNSLRHEVTGTGTGTTVRMKPLQKPENLSFGSLYDDELAKREHEEVFAVAAPSRTTPTATSDSQLDLQLNLQKQIEMLANYGYTPRQIAQSLNITVAEVDLLLKLKGER
jgi:hypothetical protein